MDKDKDCLAVRYKVESMENCHDIIYQIPYLKFDSKWQIQIIPPFAGAIVRFIVRYKETSISCYLDFYDRLGYVQQPYWEIYEIGNLDKSPERFMLNEHGEMLQRIKNIFDEKYGELSQSPHAEA